MKIKIHQQFLVTLVLFSVFLPLRFVFADISTSTDTVTVHVRYQDTIAYTGTISLPAPATVSLNDSSATPHSLSSNSALYLLSLAQATTSAFSITDLQYFSSFSSFFVNCIDINATPTIHACGNWQYAVNGVNPFVGSDQYIATTSDDIYFYYGNQRQFSVSATTTDTVTPVSVTAQRYDYTNNTWVPLVGEVVNATQPNPDDVWNPTIIASSTTDVSGVASFLFGNSGVYNMGLSDDGYYPTSLTVATATPVATPTPSSGGGGGGSSSSRCSFDISKAMQFLQSKQQSDGSFGPSLYTDWAAIAYSASGQSSGKSNLVAALKDDSSQTSATDYERHAMALMSLGVNPYNGTSVNYIQKIVDKFDGTQIGDSSLVNDDVFALFPLVKAGYTSQNSIIQKIVTFILSKQQSDGSWEGSADMTAATISALSIVPSLPGVSQAQLNAKNYLHLSEQTDGGFGSSFTTSWVLQAIASMGEQNTSWTNNSNTPYDSLCAYQQTDGGVESTSANINTRVWATSYALPAVLGKSWSALLSSFALQTIDVGSNSSTGNSGSGGGSSSTTPSPSPSPTVSPLGEVLGASTSTTEGVSIPKDRTLALSVPEKQVTREVSSTPSGAESSPSPVFSETPLVLAKNEESNASSAHSLTTFGLFGIFGFLGILLLSYVK